MTSLVKPYGNFGKMYMAFIKPFRYLVVYPLQFRVIRHVWPQVLCEWSQPRNSSSDPVSSAGFPSRPRRRTCPGRDLGSHADYPVPVSTPRQGVAGGQLLARPGRPDPARYRAVSVGYRFMLVFADPRRRWIGGNPTSIVIAQAKFILMVILLTLLNVALGLAAAGGQLILAGDAPEVGYGLHVAAYMFAAPATGMGAGALPGLLVGSLIGEVEPRWLRWPALAALLGNVGTLGGHFHLGRVWNSGNGLPAGSRYRWAPSPSTSPQPVSLGYALHRILIPPRVTRQIGARPPVVGAR